jgi:hypothetical protein
MYQSVTASGMVMNGSRIRWSITAAAISVANSIMSHRQSIL